MILDVEYLTLDQAIKDSWCYLVTGIIGNDGFPEEISNTDKSGDHDKHKLFPRSFNY